MEHTRGRQLGRRLERRGAPPAPPLPPQPTGAAPPAAAAWLIERAVLPAPSAKARRSEPRALAKASMFAGVLGREDAAGVGWMCCGWS